VLQRMNKVRVQFLKERLKMVKRYEEGTTMQALLSVDGPFPLKGMKVLDVGCGGGLFTEVRSTHNSFLSSTSDKKI
jgi:polyprenyldihydroxybenzoate methyltransferase/3-demethylubiquinol 3-O-methyltransferase